MAWRKKNMGTLSPKWMCGSANHAHLSTVCMSSPLERVPPQCSGSSLTALTKGRGMHCLFAQQGFAVQKEHAQERLYGPPPTYAQTGCMWPALFSHPYSIFAPFRPCKLPQFCLLVSGALVLAGSFSGIQGTQN